MKQITVHFNWTAHIFNSNVPCDTHNVLNVTTNYMESKFKAIQKRLFRIRNNKKLKYNYPDPYRKPIPKLWQNPDPDPDRSQNVNPAGLYWSVHCDPKWRGEDFSCSVDPSSVKSYFLCLPGKIHPQCSRGGSSSLLAWWMKRALIYSSRSCAVGH
jgi:hypothetical protein